MLPQVQAALWRRLFSSEGGPRRGWDKFYPRGKGQRPAADGKPVGAKGEGKALSASVGGCWRAALPQQLPFPANLTVHCALPAHPPTHPSRGT